MTKHYFITQHSSDPKKLLELKSKFAIFETSNFNNSKLYSAALQCEMKACIKLDENDKDLFESFMLLIVRTYEEDFKELHAAYKMKSVLLRMSHEIVQSFQTNPTNYLIRSYELAEKIYCAIVIQFSS